MSLDGFIEDGTGEVAKHLFGWMQSGPRPSTMPGDGLEFHTSSASAQYLQDSLAALGALVSGRTLFDLARGWSGRHPFGPKHFPRSACPRCRRERGGQPVGRHPARLAERRVVHVAPGGRLVCDENAWRDAVAVLERGSLELITDGGARLRLDESAVFCLTGPRLATLHNPGATPGVIALARRSTI